MLRVRQSAIASLGDQRQDVGKHLLRVAAQSFRVVHILVIGRPPDYRFPKQCRQPMATVLAGARVRQRIFTSVGQALRDVQLALRQQPAIGGNRRTTKFSISRRSKLRLRAPLYPVHPSGTPSPLRETSDNILYLR